MKPDARVKFGLKPSLFPLQFRLPVLPSQSQLSYNTTTNNLHTWEKRKMESN